MKKITLLLYLLLTVTTLDLNAQVVIGSGSTTGQAVPVEPYYGYTYAQTIYLQTEIEGAGNITELTWDFAGSSISNSNDWTIYIGHTTKTEFTGTSDWVDVTTLTQVYSGIVTLNGSNQVVVDITDFTYNNSDNLIIAVDENADNYNGTGDDFNCFLTGTSRSITYRSDGTNPNPSSPPATASGIPTSAPNIILGGITTTVSAPSCAENPTPAISATGVLLNNGDVTISWNAPSSGDSPTSYEVFWGTTSGALTSIGAIAGTTVDIIDIDFSTTYYWQIVPANAGGSATGCAEWSFTTEDAPPPPANDECGSAISLAVNADLSCGLVASATNAYATTSSQPDDAVGTPNADVWFTFVATGTAHQVSLLNKVAVVGTSTDMAMSVFDDAAGCNMVAANEVGESDPDALSLTDLTPSNTYYVRVYGYSTAQIDFDICIGTPPAPPANDECSGAINLTVNADLSCGTVTSATNASATASSQPDDAVGTPNSDVWFTFVATGTTHQVSLLNKVAALGTSTDMAMSVFNDTAGCNMVAANEVGESDPDTLSLTGLTSTNTYYVRVYGYSTAQVNFDICVGTPPPPPANDECATAITVTHGTMISGSTNSASGSSGTSCQGSIGNDVWYTYVGDGYDLSVTVTTTSTGTNPEPQVDIYMSADGSCTGFTAGTCDGSMTATSAGVNPTTTTVTTTVGTVYYIAVGSWISSSSDIDFDMEVNSSLSISENVIEGFILYPNPVNDRLNLSAKDNIDELSIYNLLGQEVLRTQPKGLTTEVDMTSLPTGMYVVKVKIGEQLGSYRVVKE
jgi:hypothetical protein